jgi:hypothetical protein
MNLYTRPYGRNSDGLFSYKQEYTEHQKVTATMISSRSLLRHSTKSLTGRYVAHWSRATIGGNNKVISSRLLATSAVASQNDTLCQQNSYGAVAAAVLLVGGAAAAELHRENRPSTNCEGRAVAAPHNLPSFTVKKPRATRKPTTDSRHHWTPSEVAREDFDEVVEAHKLDENLSTFSSDKVAENNGEDGKPIWMSYGGYVYDVTDFIQNHPGGSEKIMMAAGSVSFFLVSPTGVFAYITCC